MIRRVQAVSACNSASDIRCGKYRSRRSSTVVVMPAPVAPVSSQVPLLALLPLRKRMGRQVQRGQHAAAVGGGAVGRPRAGADLQDLGMPQSSVSNASRPAFRAATES